MNRRISKNCVFGFILSLLGIIAIPVLQVLGEGLGMRIIINNPLAFYAGIIIVEIISLVLSISGVVTASKRNLKLRGMGIVGIVISAGFLFIVLALFLFFVLGFHESPPEPTVYNGT